MRTTAIVTMLLALSAGMAYAGAAEGKDVFAAKCQSCHGANGEGKAAIGKLFGVTMRPLASKEVQAKTDADLKKQVVEGGGKMKPVAGLTAQQVTDVVAFVRTLKP